MENLHVLVCHLDLPCHPERMRGTYKANARGLQSAARDLMSPRRQEGQKTPTFGNKFKHNRFK
jgi:hypothetical protein